MPSRLLPLLLSGLVAAASQPTIARLQLGALGSEVAKPGVEHPALHQVARAELRLGRPGGPRALDVAPVPLALASARPCFPPLASRAVRAPQRKAIPPAGLVPSSRSARGPPDRLL